MRTAHRWLALALGLLFAIWAASGFALSLLPSALTRAETTSLPDFHPDLEARSYASPGGIIAQMGRATEVRLTRRMGRVVYEAHGPEGSALFDARTAERLSPLNEEAARLVASQDFAGSDQIFSATRVDFRRGEPAWRVHFADSDATRVFVSVETGAILARQNRYSAVYGFARSLHVLDLTGRGEGGNALLRLMGIAALGFSLTGVGLIVLRIKDGRYAFGRLLQRKKPSATAVAAQSPPESTLIK